MDAKEIPNKPEPLEVTPARDSDEFIGLWAHGIREAKDPILTGRGSDLEFYDHVRLDPQVWSTMQQRRDAVVARPWEVRPGAEDPASEEAAERLKKELTALDWDAKTRRMHWGLFYGYSVAECMWVPENGRWTFGDIKVRLARRFGFDIDGNLMLRQVMGRAEERMPEAKFWVLSSGVDTDDEPYGLGLAHLCYWPAYFKRAGLKSWMIALDKYASPTAYGKFPNGTSTEDQRKLLAVLQAIKQDSAGIFPEGVEIGYLQAAKSGTMDFQAFDKRMDAWIAKIVLSQTMTTDDGSSKSQSETHMEVRDEVTSSDADLICGSFNRGPVQWWTQWNFGDRAAPPEVARVMDDEEDLNEAAERDERLANIGYRPNQDRVTEKYGEGYESYTPPTLPAPQEPPALADPEPDAISRFVDDLIGSGAAPAAAADMLAPIVDAIDGAGSYDEVRSALDGLAFSDAELEPLRELLAQAAFSARIAGEVGADMRDDVTSEEV